MTDGSGTEERWYGPLGEVVKERRQVIGHTPSGDDDRYSTEYLYDSFNRLRQLIYPDGEILSYQYDSGGQVRSAEGVKVGVRYPYVQRLEYDRFGQRRFLQQGNGIRTHYDHEPIMRRLEHLEAGAFQRLTYVYDAVGNIKDLINDPEPDTEPKEYGGPVDQHYEYDTLYRLKHAHGTWNAPKGIAVGGS